jgi:hypothetical protein
MNINKVRLTAVAYHRNGIFGRGFHAVAFRALIENGWRNMIATVFDADAMEDGEVHPVTGMCAVMDADLAAKGVVCSPDNTWRGDNFEPQLRQWIAQHRVELAAALAEVDRVLANPQPGPDVPPPVA